MSDNMNEHRGDSGQEIEVAALLRRADEAAVRALRARLDIEGRLAEVTARGDAERATAEYAFGADTWAVVLASWSVELTTAAVRAQVRERRIVRVVDDPDFFVAAVGRPREGLEPWPDMVLTIGADQTDLLATLSLPNRPPRGVKLVVAARLNAWRVESDLAAIEDAVADDLWPIDLTAQLRLPPAEAGTIAELVINLRAVSIDERQ